MIDDLWVFALNTRICLLLLQLRKNQEWCNIKRTLKQLTPCRRWRRRRRWRLRRWTRPSSCPSFRRSRGQSPSAIKTSTRFPTPFWHFSPLPYFENVKLMFSIFARYYITTCKSLLFQVGLFKWAFIIQVIHLWNILKFNWKFVWQDFTTI